MSDFEFQPMLYNIEQARTELHRLGHFHPIFDGHADVLTVAGIDSQAHEFKTAVQSFQRYMGLVPDGKLAQKTLTALTTRFLPDGSFRCCGRPDIEAVTEEANIPNGTVSWPTPEQPILVGYNFTSLPGLTAEQTRTAYTRALEDINSNCGVRLQLAPYADAEVQIALKGLNGGTLAIALLSLGRRGRGTHWQQYDSSNRTWYPDLAQEVICHETLHTLGFSHSRDPGAVMYPTASGRKIVMQNDDKNRAVGIYGPSFGDTPDPGPEPEPPNIPDGEQPFSGMVQIGGKVINLTGTATVI